MAPQTLVLRRASTVQLIAAAILVVLAAAMLFSGSGSDPSTQAATSTTPAKIGQLPQDDVVVLAKTLESDTPDVLPLLDVVRPSVTKSVTKAKETPVSDTAPASEDPGPPYDSFQWGIWVANPAPGPITGGEEEEAGFGLTFYEGPEDDTSVEPVAEPLFRQLCDFPVGPVGCRPVDAYNPSDDES